MTPEAPDLMSHQSPWLPRPQLPPPPSAPPSHFLSASPNSGLPVDPPPPPIATWPVLPLKEKDEVKLANQLKWLERVNATRPFTKERNNIVQDAADFMEVDPTTMRTWNHRVAAGGEIGLYRKQRCDKGRARCKVSAAFDLCVKDPDVLQRISDDLDDYIKSLWTSRAWCTGSRNIARLAKGHLVELARAAELDLPLETCCVPRKRVERFAKLRKIGQRRFDAKAFSDQTPRIRRSWLSYDPCEVVVLDVKHLDVVMRREDGTPGYPKIIAFLCAGTGRLFAWPVLLPKNEKVRREHVATSFIGLVGDEDFGMPKAILFDHGRENGYVKLLRGPLATLSGNQRVLIQSAPYSPQGKPVESAFARFDQLATKLLEGYIGPNRMATKVGRVGKDPDPYRGTIDDLREHLADLCAYYNSTPFQSGERKGFSPDQIYAQKVADGWRRTPVDPLHLEQVFATHKTYVIDRGKVRIGDTVYTHKWLWGIERRVRVAIPYRPGVLPLFKVDGKPWTILEEDFAFRALDPAGAMEAALRKAQHKRAATEAARGVKKIDAGADARKYRPTEAAPVAETDLPLDLGEATAERAEVYREAAKAPPPPPEPTLDEIQMAELDDYDLAS